MRRALGVSLSAILIAAPLALVASQASSSAAAPAPRHVLPNNATTKIARFHFCGNNGITCAEPFQDWDEFAGYDKAMKHGAHISAATSATTSRRRCSTRTGPARATT